MQKSFEEALKHRRTYYSISNQSPISDKEIERIVDFAVTNIPSAFNSQSTPLFYFWVKIIKNSGK